MNLGRATTAVVAKAIRDAPVGRHWQLKLTQSHDLNMAAVKAWKPDGVIGRVGERGLAQQLAQLDTRVLNISSYLQALEGPRCTWDDHAVGRMAAEYLLERNFMHFAVASSTLEFAPGQRAKAFRERVERAGRHCHDITAHEAARDEHRWSDAVAMDDLRRLPKPLAVFAASRDEFGVELCDACEMIGLKVPDEVAVLGVGNTPLICEMSHPPLSSVEMPSREVGLRAAKLMDRWIRDGVAPPAKTWIAPQRVVTRTSTDVVASADPVVARALRMIRDRACEPLSVSDLVAELPLSRRPFEKRFRAAVGRTPLQEIHRVQVQRAGDLLIDTDRTVTDIALTCGFASSTRLGEAFRRLTGLSPTDYRRCRRDPG
jgi:LacI family transcriptional regulator